MSSSGTFSYAQAAKGQPTTMQSTTASQSSSESQALSTTSTQSRDVVPTPSTRAPSVAISTTSNELDGSQNTRSSSVKAESVSLNSADSDIASTSDKAAELSSLPSQGEKVLGEVVPQSAGRRGRGQTLTSQTTDSGDGKRGRKGKKSRATEKESSQDQDQEKKENLPPKPELSEAPVPAVNVWTQRQEARAAKIKTISPTTTQPRSSSSATANQPDGLSNATTQDQKQKSPQNEGVEVNAAHSRPSSGNMKPKKEFDQFRSNGNQTTRRAAPRGARLNNGEERASLETLSPAANNTSSWPTPETAASGLKTQAQTGKSEKEQKDDSAPSKPRSKKEWQPIEFVPSVSFNTPIPSRGGSRGGRGGLRGGRDAAARGNHAATASLDRTQYNGTATGSATIAASASKRASIDMSTARDSRKLQAQAASGKTSGESQFVGSKADASKQNSPDPAINGAAGQHAPARIASSNQRADETQKSSPPVRDGVKDSSFQSQNPVSRNERMRGGARGRGGHSAVNGAGHSQSQFNQGSNGYYPSNGNVRQPSHPYTNGYVQMPYGGAYPAQATGSQHRSRPSSGSNRAQHARHPSSRASSYPAVGMPYEPPAYPQSNGPYGGYGDPSHLLSGVLSQVEYYFSIDNLCKDTYLRKWMDSQGFVPLPIIAAFKRMQEIAEYPIIRIACDTSPLIEFVVTEDGQDKVRRRENWEQWVLEIGTRFPQAQNDGPTSYRPFNSQLMYWPQMNSYVGEAPHMFSPTNADAHFTPYLYGNGVASPTSNGINGNTHPSDSQLSAAVPEFSPIGNPTMGMTSQEGEAVPAFSSNGLVSNNADRKTTTLPFGEQVGSLPNGSHSSGREEQASISDETITNGTGAGPEREA
ncbi:hypothetical protein GL218_03880 [Daldinia childiae]|uniref:uncharacterized protein n=1 Tax=Daldinia childiae TaxID=326645 RepID=UPI0014485830|nr:uncharacterized protein GL218_03880 [Daldinia childiae]KAF3062472.1 hypothetical protein GL218_03880 [Daldinia childiae]